MLQRGDLFSHLAQLNVTNLPARLVEEINQSAGRRADKHDKKAHRPDEDCYSFRHITEAMQHDQENFFPPTYPRNTNRQGRNRAFNRHDGEKIEYGDAGPKCVGNEEKGGKGSQMSDHGSNESKKRRIPVTSVKMISRGELD